MFTDSRSRLSCPAPPPVPETYLCLGEAEADDGLVHDATTEDVEGLQRVGAPDSYVGLSTHGGTTSGRCGRQRFIRNVYNLFDTLNNGGRIY